MYFILTVLSTTKRFSTAALAFAVIAGFGCGDVQPTDVDHQIHRQEIKGGEHDETSTYAVGIIAADGYAGGICSGTLIAPNLVLTAQHCVAQVSSAYVQCGSTEFGQTMSPSNIYVTADSVMRRSSRFVQAAEIHTPPGSNDMCGHDIALITLTELINPGTAEPIPPRIDIPPQEGEIYSAIGYGHTGDGRGSGVRRRIDGRQVVCNGNDCPGYSSVQTSEFYGTDGTCQGDSGGTALDEDGRVIGALSRGPSGCRASVYSGVYKWGQWIRDIGGEAAASAGYAEPFWVETGLSEEPENDRDLDEVLDDEDNCPDVPNPEQIDTDGDGQGDACDDLIDSDGDAIADDEDNCPDVPNPDQIDTDGDGQGDECDDLIDSDGDEIADDEDNCPDVYNPDQTNSNEDGFGDACAPPGVEVLSRNAVGSDGGCASVASGTSTWPVLILAALLWFRRRIPLNFAE